MTYGYTLRDEQYDLPMTDLNIVAGLSEQQCTTLRKLCKKSMQRAGERSALIKCICKNGSIKTVGHTWLRKSLF
jgi:hypothetical protein